MNYKSAYDIAEAFGYLTEGEVYSLKKLVRLLPENPVVVIIGVGAGTSSVAVLEERDDLRLISIDIRQDSPFGGLQNELNAIELRGIDVKDRHEQILGDSKRVAKDFDRKVDMVFIDGDHSYVGCAGDIRGWVRHVKPTGIIAIDDYGANKHGDERWPAVKEAVDDLLRPKFNEILMLDSIVAFEIV
jgi:predicted O-methyltransferase YrrM